MAHKKGHKFINEGDTPHVRTFEEHPHKKAQMRRQRDKDSANAQSLRKIRDEKWDAIKPHEETLKFDTKFETSL